MFAHDRLNVASAEQGPELEELVPCARKEIGEGRPGPAANRLFAMVRGPVVGYCRARVGIDRAEDVAQETWAGVLNALRGRPVSLDRPFEAFVNGIARHKTIDAHRSAARACERERLVRDVPDRVSHEQSPEEHALAAELRRALNRCLEDLPPLQRTVIELRVMHGLTADETAAAIGSTAGSVRVMKARALAALRAQPALSPAPHRAMPSSNSLAPVLSRDAAVAGVRR